MFAPFGRIHSQGSPHDCPFFVFERVRFYAESNNQQRAEILTKATFQIFSGLGIVWALK
jgi:hypothetical protein